MVRQCLHHERGLNVGSIDYLPTYASCTEHMRYISESFILRIFPTDFSLSQHWRRMIVWARNIKVFLPERVAPRTLYGWLAGSFFSVHHLLVWARPVKPSQPWSLFTRRLMSFARDIGLMAVLAWQHFLALTLVDFSFLKRRGLAQASCNANYIPISPQLSLKE